LANTAPAKQLLAAQPLPNGKKHHVMTDAPSPLPALLARLEAWLTAHRPEYAATLAPALPAEERKEHEARLGVPLPQELRAIYDWRNGQTHSGFSLVGRYWLLSVAQLETQRIEGRKAGVDMDDEEGWWSESWFPFADDGQGNLLCIDASDGRLLQYFQDDPDRDTVAPSATALFACIVEGLESGVLVPAEEPWAGVVPNADAPWQALRAKHGVTIPLAYAPRP
jgi:cell wall assembly regulator SMI1